MRTMSGDPCLHYDCTNRNSFGYCKTTACINPKYSNIGTAQYGQGVQKRIVTNADHIRAMTDEELASKFEKIQLEAVKAYGNDCMLLEGELRRYWLRWLQQEGE